MQPTDLHRRLNIMENANKNSEITQKDIIQFLLQQAQHTVTREELKDEIRELKNDLINKIDASDKKIDDAKNELNKNIDDVKNELNKKIDDVRSEIKGVKSELKSEIKDVRSEIKDVRSEIKEVRSEIKDIRSELKEDYLRLNKKFDRLTWYIVATIISIFAKDYIIEAIEKLFGQQ